MVRVMFHNPRLNAWQHRLARIPRWGWTIIGVAIVLPIVLLLLSVVAMALIAGAVALAVVIALLVLRGIFLRLKGPKDDGRRKVKIVVRRDVFLD